jgi:hypothetical protein
MSEFARPISTREGGTVTYGTDEGFLVEFEMKPHLMEFMSKENGHPTYQDRIFTRMISPGNTKTIWYHETKGIVYQYDDEGQVCGYEVQDPENGDLAEPNRFPKAWARFTAKGQKVKEGWAIEEWGAVTRSFGETLKAMNIHTVEALAALSDANAQSFLGGTKFRNLAKAALDEAEVLSLASKEQERANKSEEENKQLRKDIEALKSQVAALADRKHKAA